MHLNDSFSLVTLTSLARPEGRRADIPFLDESGGEVDRHEGPLSTST